MTAVEKKLFYLLGALVGLPPVLLVWGMMVVNMFQAI